MTEAQLKKISKQVGKQLAQKKRTLAIAESCTGGWIAKAITDISGSSRCFSGGVVAYSDRSKKKLLKITPSMLKKRGAVSEEVARKMAENVRRLFRADYGLAVTGIAGPGGGTQAKPVGLTFVGFASGRETCSSEFLFKSNRRGNRIRTVEESLKILLNAI